MTPSKDWKSKRTPRVVTIRMSDHLGTHSSCTAGCFGVKSLCEDNGEAILKFNSR